MCEQMSVCACVCDNVAPLAELWREPVIAEWPVIVCVRVFDELVLCA